MNTGSFDGSGTSMVHMYGVFTSARYFITDSLLLCSVICFPCYSAMGHKGRQSVSSRMVPPAQTLLVCFRQQVL